MCTLSKEDAKRLSKDTKSGIQAIIDDLLKDLDEYLKKALNCLDTVKKSTDLYIITYDARQAFLASKQTGKIADKLLKLHQLINIEPTKSKYIKHYHIKNLLKSDLKYIKNYINKAYATSNEALQNATQAALDAANLDDVARRYANNCK